MSTSFERSLENLPVSPPRPLGARGVISRFGFAYWLLFCFSISSQIEILEWLNKAVAPAWDAMVTWVGTQVLAISYDFSTAANGSGDKTADWVSLFCVAGLSAIVTVVWSVIDRKTTHDDRVRALVHVVVRYTLAFVLLSYGVSKLFFGQFPPPSPFRLVQRYGDSSPMGLLWTFMGASPAYVFFSGAGETLGALLLLFRRTTTLGALVLGVVLTNVVMLNFCYDVPVKINSAHYLAMCVYLLLPDVRLLANVLVLGRAAQPLATPSRLPKRWMRIARLVIKYGLIGLVVFVNLKGEITRPRAGDSPKTWYDGYWNVSAFQRDGQDVPPLVTDQTRWRRIRLQIARDTVYARWRFMDDSSGSLYMVAVDDKAQTMTFTPVPGEKPSDPGPLTFRYERIDATHFKLEGRIGEATVTIQFEPFDPGSMLLRTRGFHWINEVPFNR